MSKLRHLVVVLAVMLALPAWAASPLGAPNDHFLCYKTKNTKSLICKDGAVNEGAVCTTDADCGGAANSCVKNKRAKFERLVIDSVDGNTDTDIIKTSGLCLPADKNQEGVVDSTTHLLQSKIKTQKEEGKHTPRTFAVLNQFGALSVDTIKADSVLVPAAKDPLAAIAPPVNTAHVLDRMKCYKVKVTKQTPKFLGTTVSLDDQFIADEGGDKYFVAKKPTKLCVAASIFGSPIRRPNGYQMCYKAKLASKSPAGAPISQTGHTPRTGLFVNSEFGPEQLDTTKPAELCVPTIVLDPECEVLNGAECLLPYPSNFFTVADPSTDTGLRLNIPQKGMLNLNPAVSPAPLNQLDGFSPTAQILMHFPQGVDLALSDTARLLAPACCGQPAGPPWIDTRTYDGRSLDSDSPSVLMKASTGERIIHWLELDARSAGNPARQSLVMRPGKALEPNTRYIVAMRNLKTPGGADVVPEAAFEAYRDGIGVGIAALDVRRAAMEDTLDTLETNGVDREDLVLAFDFTTQSDDQLTRQMLSMRDQAFAWLDTVEADPMQVPFSITSTTTNTCTPSQVVWRVVKGTFQSPLFLTDVPTSSNVPQLNVDANDVPVQNGFMNTVFDISIPCSVFDPMKTSRPLVLGHGLFGTGAGMVSSIPPAAGQVVDWTYIAGGTDWRGLSNSDFSWVGTQIIGVGTNKLNNFPAFTDRLRQGMLNTLVLGRMMKAGIFNRHTTFEKSPGVGVFPGPSEEMYYYGISLGGIMGTWFSAVTPDIERFGVDVPAINFSCLLQRSTQFSTFDSLLANIGLTDPMKAILGLGLLHELWVSAEPAGYVRHITTDPLPGSGTAKKLLVTAAWLDKQVSNQCTEAEVRSLGIGNLTDSSIQAQLQQIPDVTGPQNSAYIMYNTGSFDLFDPAHQPFIPPLANVIPSGVCDPHGARPAIPASVEQLYTFLQPGGQIVNFCNGICDAGDPTETANGNPPCDPTP